MATMEDVPLDTSTSDEPVIKKGSGFWSKEYVCTRVKLFALFTILVVFLVIIIILAALLGHARSRRSKGSDDGPQTGGTSAPAPTTPGTEAWWQIRLPRNVVPVHYNVFLNVTVDLPRYDGNVEVEVNVTSPTDLILIHSLGLNITQLTVKKKVKSKDNIPIRRHFEFKKNEFYVIQTDSMLSPSLYVVTMHYEGFFSRDLRGLYRSTYKYPNGKLSNFASTQFEPVRARTAFPCFDEPALKATFNVTIAHHPQYIALSNMPIYRSVAVRGQTHDYFGKTVVMPTYLVALAVGDFKYRKIVTKNNVEMRIYSRPSVVNHTTLAANDGSKIMTFFEEYFGVKYTLPKADMIALPDFGPGAMENWGLITYRERYLLWEASVSSEWNKVTTSNIISHEIAHQWFGNIVTMKWWDDLWLNEGFATYMTSKGTADAHPTWQMDDRNFWSSFSTAIPLDGLVSSHPVKVRVNGPNEIFEIFDAISYRKGSSILAMLESFLGRIHKKTRYVQRRNRRFVASAEGVINGSFHSLSYPVITKKREFIGWIWDQVCKP
ncbi:Endoplasmic reticulum aminopeptidase 1 [Exaiptasia diaphana]|nr:Endoplasmic reticulum aminopeptidase 1 [Exaiptasia diaphana]